MTPITTVVICDQCNHVWPWFCTCQQESHSNKSLLWSVLIGIIAVLTIVISIIHG